MRPIEIQMVNNMTVVKGRNEALTELVERAVKTIKSNKQIRDCGCATAFFTLDSRTIKLLRKEGSGSLEEFEGELEEVIIVQMYLRCSILQKRAKKVPTN